MRITELNKPADLDILRHHPSTQDPPTPEAPLWGAHDVWRETVSQTLAKHGFTPIGRGIAADVFSNPSYPWVLKVFRASDAEYLSWVSFCSDHTHNPFCPRFRGKALNLTPGLMAIRIEKLHSLDDEDYERYRTMMHDLMKTRGADPFLDEIHAFLAGKPSDLDPHNVMKRANGQLVIIDPFWPVSILG